MVASQTNPTVLLNHRNRTVAKSFYKSLRDQGFDHEQILRLSTTLIDLVTEEMRPDVDEA